MMKETKENMYLTLPTTPCYEDKKQRFVFPYAYNKKEGVIVARALYLEELTNQNILTEIEIVTVEIELNADFSVFDGINITNVMEDYEIVGASILMMAELFEDYKW